jgi:diguanylate cyclase (GGDEF)-like protein
MEHMMTISLSPRNDHIDRTAEGRDSQLAHSDVALESALAHLWRRHRQISLDRISLIESTTADVLRSVVDDDATSQAASAAHKLAGSLGTFGFHEGSRAALEAEHLLRESVIDGRLLSEAVVALRGSVKDEFENSTSVIDRAPDPEDESSADAAVLVVSPDPDLIARLTVQAAAIGLSVASSTAMPILGVSTGYSAIIVDEGPVTSRIRSDLLASITMTATTAAVVVLTDRDTFEDRAEFTRAGAAGVMSRSEASGEIASFVAESVAKVASTPSIVLSFNVSAGLEDALHRVFADSDCHLDIRGSATELWDTLDEQGADLVVLGFAGSQLSGPELCRMIRAHPRWHRLPVVVMGGRSQTQLDQSYAAGADDYLNIGISSHDLGVRLRHRLAAGKLTESRNDRDPVTGTWNRTATERLLNQRLRLASGHDEPFALALVTIDHFDQIRAAEGTAMADAILRRLGAGLVGFFQGNDITGRWTDDGFALGIAGASGEEAAARIADVLETLAEDQTSTDPDLTRHSFSVGIASAPADGSRLASLERTCETALRRASLSENDVATYGERIPRQTSDVITDVVLVEDDDAMADVIEHALGLHHYQFIRFGDGADAATALGQGHVRAKVVLLDVGLPSLDGFGVLRVLRSKGILSETRVIMLTARSSEEEMLRGIGLGATEHITKPFSIPVLLARLAQTQIGNVA